MRPHINHSSLSRQSSRQGADPHSQTRLETIMPAVPILLLYCTSTTAHHSITSLAARESPHEAQNTEGLRRNSVTGCPNYAASAASRESQMPVDCLVRGAPTNGQTSQSCTLRLRPGDPAPSRHSAACSSPFPSDDSVT